MEDQVISARSNIYYGKNEDGFKPLFEIIILVDGAEYRSTNEGDIIRERRVEQKRFTTGEDGLRVLAKMFTELADKKDAALIPEG